MAHAAPLHAKLYKTNTTRHNVTQSACLTLEQEFCMMKAAISRHPSALGSISIQERSTMQPSSVSCSFEPRLEHASFRFTNCDSGMHSNLAFEPPCSWARFTRSLREEGAIRTSIFSTATLGSPFALPLGSCLSLSFSLPSSFHFPLSSLDARIILPEREYVP